MKKISTFFLVFCLMCSPLIADDDNKIVTQAKEDNLALVFDSDLEELCRNSNFKTIQLQSTYTVGDQIFIPKDISPTICQFNKTSVETSDQENLPPYFLFTAENTDELFDRIDYLQMMGYGSFKIVEDIIDLTEENWLSADLFSPLVQEALKIRSKIMICSRNDIERDKKFVFIIPAYKVRQWCHLNLSSCFKQKYKNWRMIYIDDCSPDENGRFVQEHVIQNGFQNKVTVIQNKKRSLAMANIYNAIQMCHDDEICILLDGDDWLDNDNVLDILNKIYKNKDIWLTYGSYRWNTKTTGPACTEYPQWVIDQNQYREFGMYATHLRSCYVWLFKKIKRDDLLYKGDFFAMAWDLAIMFPLLEMSGGRFVRIADILYVYNVTNPCHDGNPVQGQLGNIISKQDKYNSLLPIIKK